MEYKKDPFSTDNIPDFAMQPAKPAEDIDTTVYDRLYGNMADPVNEIQKEGPEATEDSQQQDVVLVSAPEADTVQQPEEEPPQEEAVSSAAVVEPIEEAAVDESIVEAAVDEPAVEAAAVEPEPVEIALGDEAEADEAENDEEENASFGQEDRSEVIPVSLTKASPARITPAGKSQINRTLNYTDFRKLVPVIIHIEEDVLVPDIKPDLDNILCVEGKCRLAERNVHTGSSGTQAIRVAGDLSVQTVYAAEDGDAYTLVPVDTRLPFREDCPVNASPNGYLALSANVVSLEHEKINERKYRIIADVSVNIREYRSKGLDLFSRIDGEDVEYLDGSIRVTDVALRKTETMEVSDELVLKDGAPEIENILCCNVNIVENHKQISREKAVINASAYCNIMYQGENGPENYQGRTEFTQFMKMDDDGSFSHPLTGSKVTFDMNNLSIVPKEDVKGDNTLFGINMDVDTTIEYYRQLEEPTITDLYHYSKDVRFDTEPVECMELHGNGSSEATVREIISVPERYGTGSRVVYMSGSPIIRKELTDTGKCAIEGFIPVKIVCLSGEDKESVPFCLEQDLDFRAALDFPGCEPGMDVDSQAYIKELWYDQINSRQIEVNAIIGINVNVFGKVREELIQTVSFIQTQESEGSKPAMIVYVAKDGDNAWRVAKKYRTKIEHIKEVNGIDEKDNIKKGTKLLIIR